MTVQLAVPVVAQTHPYECWYVAVCMVGYFQFPGPRLGVPRVWSQSDKRGMFPAEFVELARNEGLIPVNVPPVCSSQGLEHQLRGHGPIWCAGYWDGPGHVVVLTGVDGDIVHFNDPAGGRKRYGTVSWFNAKLARSVPNCMLAARFVSSWNPRKPY